MPVSNFFKRLYRKILNLNKERAKGATLVETLVAVFVFGIVVIIFGGSFAQALRVQRRAFNTQQIEDSASFILATMTKELRVSAISTGSDTSCPSFPGNSLTITHPVNGTITYAVVNSAVHRTVGGVDTVISPDGVEFTLLQFCVSGSNLADQKQPRITIMARVRSKNVSEQASVDVQTTVSARQLTD